MSICCWEFFALWHNKGTHHIQSAFSVFSFLGGVRRGKKKRCSVPSHTGICSMSMGDFKPWVNTINSIITHVSTYGTCSNLDITYTFIVWIHLYTSNIFTKLVCTSTLVAVTVSSTFLVNECHHCSSLKSYVIISL